MSSLETTELKLKSTPTGGVDAAHSPYYRRLLSAGYKGFLQGTIGGAALYGIFGLVIGGLAFTAALPFVAAGSAGMLAAIIPASAALGVLKGATTFGQIGSMAAITAESSDLSEQRRYLLERYYDLPEGPEGDKEAAAIKQELLKRAGDTGKPPHFFHWKSVAVCGALGGALVLAALAPFGLSVGATAVLDYLLGAKVAAVVGSIAPLALGIAGTAIGALAGATFGIDRFYIRKWFDMTQDVIHSSSHRESALMERHKQVERIVEAAKQDAKTKQKIENQLNEPVASPAVQESEPKPPTKPVAALDKPSTQVSSARREGLAAIQKAMEIPVI